MIIMKKTSVIINVSRGGVVNERDLNKALNKKIAAKTITPIPPVYLTRMTNQRLTNTCYYHTMTF